MSDGDAVSLLDEKRQITVERICRAALALVRDRGLDVTMDDIAQAAGVSRRTLFRHFDTRERLLARAVARGVEVYGDHLPVFEGGDAAAWLRALCDAAHRMQADYGAGYWELLHRTDLPSELAAVERDRRERRRRAMRRIAEALWRGSGHAGAVPSRVVGVVAGHLSARFTVAVIEEGGQSWQVAADLAYDAIASALDLPH